MGGVTIQLQHKRGDINERSDMEGGFVVQELQPGEVHLPKTC